jgi:two-component system, OmpR family, phosphate regulon sensor histidine kinase PhoR
MWWLLGLSGAFMAAWEFGVQNGIVGWIGGGPVLAAFVVFAYCGYRLRSSVSRIKTESLEQHATTDILRSEIEQQSQAIDTFADGLDLAVLICDQRATVEYANQSARQIFRFAEPVGRSILAMTLSYDLEQLVLNAAKTDTTQAKEIAFPPPEGTVVLAKAWVGSKSDRIFLSMYDVTKVRRLERVRQDFVANVSHELRTPMSIIRAYAETLLDEETPDQLQLHRYLTGMIEEVDRLSGITRDLLVLSAAESDKVHRVPCDLAEIVTGVVDQLRPKAEAKQLAFTYEGPPQLDAFVNPTQLTQVALNLIDNAINYTQKGSVAVRLTTLPAGEIELRVKDTGIGIATEHQSRVVERFYRVDKSRSRSTGGTGLGLSIVKHIVDAHHGSLALESSINIGSEFTVHLPSPEEPPGPESS